MYTYVHTYMYMCVCVYARARARTHTHTHTDLAFSRHSTPWTTMCAHTRRCICHGKKTPASVCVSHARVTEKVTPATQSVSRACKHSTLHTHAHTCTHMRTHAHTCTPQVQDARAVAIHADLQAVKLRLSDGPSLTAQVRDITRECLGQQESVCSL